MNNKRIVILVLFLIVISIGFGILYKRNFIEPFEVTPTSIDIVSGQDYPVTNYTHYTISMSVNIPETDTVGEGATILILNNNHYIFGIFL